MTARDDIIEIPNELLRTGRVAEAGLVFMDFGSGSKRWWTGTGTLASGGHVWDGLGDVIEIGQVVTSYLPTAEPLTFSLAATPEMIALTENAEADVVGRTVKLFGHMFRTEDDGDNPPWTPIGAPYAHFAGTMEEPRYAISYDEARITLTCEGWLYRRAAPPRGRLTHIDQITRHPGDRGLDYVSRYESYETRWV